MTGEESKVDSRARRKALGAYYTPDSLSAVVAKWAITRPDDTVLEPGFGGCGFLVAAKQRLDELGQENPLAYIHGCDVDEEAFKHLKLIFGAKPSAQHFPHIDFLLTESGKTWGGQKFRVALGNPPYVAYQALSQRQAYQALMKRSGWSGLSARASLWAYFVLHVLSFLEKGGRVAWVLPGSLLRANYSKFIKEVFATRFSRAALFHVHERLFSPAGAAEETVVLCADGFDSNENTGGALQEYFVERVQELEPALETWNTSDQPIALTVVANANSLTQSFADSETTALKALLSARIGLVTGDNKFFLFSESRAREENISLETLQPVLAKGSMAPGLNFGLKELRAARKAGTACYLLSSPALPAEDAQVSRYLESYPLERIENVSTFKKRARWHEPEDHNVPDAFWPVMRDLGPKLILNSKRWHCTNTLHRIFFKDHVTKLQQQFIAVSLLSTYAQLCAELCGRSYGSGVLKHEPRDVESIRIPWSTSFEREPLVSCFNAIDKALREGRHVDATRLADDYIYSNVSVAYTPKFRELLKTSLGALRHVRLPQRRTQAKT